MVLIQPVLENIPAQLHPHLLESWEKISPALVLLDQTPQWLASELSTVLIGSDFVRDQLMRHPEWLQRLQQSGDLEQACSEQQYRDLLHALVQPEQEEADLHRVLRQFRQYQMVRLIWRDLTRRSDMIGTTHELSWLADVCIDETLNWLYEKACERWGTPWSRPDAQGRRQQQRMVVLGMGKLGAHELNLSSDIDLMFTYPSNGETDHERKNLENQDFFIRLGQKLIQALDNLTGDGFVFRVDMRLRPFGTSGTLACSFDAMEGYYQDQGRDWERYAMIKSRVVAGDKAQGERLQSLLRPFVYRKYIDFSAFESLRDMKLMISREVRRKGLEDNVKLGSGGIREVEFIAQAFQLIRGGRDLELRQRELMNILPLLPERVGMPQQAVDELIAAYTFLRNTEHAIQALADQQTQELPADDLGRARIAHSMGFADWQSFHEQLMSYRATVSRHFADVIAPEESEDDLADSTTETDWQALWHGEMDDAEAHGLLAERGFKDADKAFRLIQDLRNLKAVQVLQQVAQQRLLNVLPNLLEAIAQCDNPEVTLERVLLLIQAILRRSAYLVLLAENPAALQQLVRLCSASAWFANLLAKQPVLMDELIDPRTLYDPPDKARLQAELRQQLLRIPQEDTEQLMEALRYFKHAHVLRVAASEVTGVLPLMKVSDYLTWLAEAVLEVVLDIAWHDLISKYGRPLREPGIPCDPDFVVLGYGKVGGIELSYGSDLDLVFLYDADSNLNTDGEKQVPNPVFFNRLGQKMIHILNTFTPSGQLYEVDMRLRPSGNSGLLVSTLKAFGEYQQREAWTWEHQALVRARVVAGCPRVKERFEQTRAEILGADRELEKLRTDVVEMREKMRQHLGSGVKEEDAFHLKQDRGGIVDIEFLVQFHVLAYATRHPDLLEFTDNIRILDAIERNALLSAEEADFLRETYKTYRAMGHRLALQEQSSTIADDQFAQLRTRVGEIWDRVMTARP